MDPNILTVYKSPFQKIRLGKDNDGGYIIAEVPNPCYKILLGGGIETDISFEEDFINKYPNITSFAFDGTIDKLPKDNINITFIKKNIGFENNEQNTNIHDIINVNDSIFVKMDIEGGEIPWIKSLSDEQMNKFEQIVMEFHFPFTDKEIDVFDKINKNHYLIHFHGNNNCGVRNHNNVYIPNVFECTYLHKKHFTNIPELNKDLIPSILDMRNTGYDEININYPPFVNVVDYEGHSGELSKQTDRLQQLCSNIEYKNILEIGFNAGHSAYTFLSSSLANVVSFDLNVRGSVLRGKQYIDYKFPKRHTLILGDSTQTILEYISLNPDSKFDLIFIDGGHTYEIAMADLLNCKALSHINTVVVMDNVLLHIKLQQNWTIGPSKVWAEAVLKGIIGDYSSEIYEVGRGMAWGKYKF